LNRVVQKALNLIGSHLYTATQKMVHQLGDLGILIDFGKNEPGSILQHYIPQGQKFSWQNYLVDGNPITAPVDVKTLPPGEYRLI